MWRVSVCGLCCAADEWRIVDRRVASQHGGLAYRWKRADSADSAVWELPVHTELAYRGAIDRYEQGTASSCAQCSVARMV